VTGLGDAVALLDRVYRAGGAASVAVFHEGGVHAAMHATYAAWRVPAEHDRPAGLLIQVIDTSDHARAAEELREVNRRLLQAGLDAEVRAESHIALNAALQERERRLEVALEEQARLLVSEQVARDVAERALRVRDEFLAVAAHELRSPLTAIRGTAQLARRALDRGTLDAAQAQRNLDNIVASTGRLEALLTDLLDVSRMRVQGLSARLEPMDLAALAGAAARRYQEIADRTRIVCDVPQQPVLVRGDASRLEQVLDNLLSNAVKYSPAGGEVVLHLCDVSGGVVLTVRDSGIGLPPGAEQRIFDPFQRAPNAVTHGVPGIGLGLYISRQIAEAHGGTLRAESEGEGLGATITLWLPMPNSAPEDS
jgi:signal transduction histidine kinase